MKNIFYFWHINKIGGIESFFYYLSKKYKDWDITIYYKEGDPEQIRRLKKYVRVKQYNGQKIVCDKAFFNYTIDIINNVEAKEYYQIAHCDFKESREKPNLDEKVTTYLGVSKKVCKSFEEVTGFETKLVYNPIILEKPKKVLNLISATRLTHEKGRKRIEKFAKLLDENSIPYIWTIFTNDENAIKNPNIAYMKPKHQEDLINYIANADYLVQLSDNEGFCYSVVESLCVSTPVIVTECPVFDEIGVKDGINGFIVDFDLSNVNIKDIYNKRLKFEYTPPKDAWGEILAKGKSTYQKDLKTKVKVKAIEQYDDVELNRTIKLNEEFTVSKVRAENLEEVGAVIIL